MRKRVEIAAGMRFGRLKVLRTRVDRDKHGKHLHLCRCDCGTERAYVQGNLAQGLSTSCGCVGIERLRTGTHTRTHGMSATSEWLAHKNMMDRCYNPKSVGYHRYGGRGITVCKRWQGSGGFERFYADVGPKPTPRHTLGRKDNDGTDRPDNVGWETPVEQGRNQSTNRLLSFSGKTLTLADWARELKCKKETLHRRLDVYGWSIAKALSTPTKQYRARTPRPPRRA